VYIFRWKKVLHWFLLGGFELADMQAEMYKSALSFGLLRREVVLVSLFPLDKVILAPGGGEFTPPRYPRPTKTDSRSFQVTIYRESCNMIYHGEYRVLIAPIS
jgi:hypothetical protein